MSNFFNPISMRDIEESKSNLFDDIGTLWDPIGKINIEEVKSNAAKIGAKYEFLVKNPNKPKKQLYFSLLFTTIVLVLLLIIFIFGGVFDIQIAIFVIIIALIPVGITRSYYKNLIIDLVKLQIAKKNSWLYDPERNYSRWQNLQSIFPELFKKGDESQNVEDQFWGSINKNGKDYKFYTALFHYTTVSRDSKGRRHTTIHNKHFFSIRLDKELQTRFHLYPENVLSKIGNFFTKKEINTESIEFNKTFAFSYNGSKGEKALQIVKTLSPAVQTKLIDLNREKKGVEILFAKDSVIFMFKGNFFNHIESNFFKQIELSNKDQKFFEEKISSLIEISTEMAKYIN